MAKEKKLDVKKYRLPIKIEIPKTTLKEFKEGIEAGKVGGVSWGSYKKIKGNKDLVEVSVFVDADTNMDSLNIGYALNELKFASAAISQAKLAKKLESKKGKPAEPIVLTFTTAIRKEFLELYGKELKVLKTVASADGRTTDFYIDSSHIYGRKELFNFAKDIYSKAESCFTNGRNKHELKYINDVITDLEEFNNFDQTHTEYTRMTGKELIDSGEATVFDSNKKPARLFTWFLKILFGAYSPKLEYLYFTQVVDPDKTYVVKHAPKKLAEPMPINHINNVWLAYDWGNQVYAGYGVKEVEKYYKNIIKLNNKAVNKSE